jgi:hypothetical protein
MFLRGWTMLRLALTIAWLLSGMAAMPIQRSLKRWPRRFRSALTRSLRRSAMAVDADPAQFDALADAVEQRVGRFLAEMKTSSGCGPRRAGCPDAVLGREG